MRKFTYKNTQLKFMSQRLSRYSLLAMCEASEMRMHNVEMSISLGLYFAYACTYNFICTSVSETNKQCCRGRQIKAIEFRSAFCCDLLKCPTHTGNGLV